jgi:hypothetical protein
VPGNYFRGRGPIGGAECVLAGCLLGEVAMEDVKGRTIHLSIQPRLVRWLTNTSIHTMGPNLDIHKL